MAERVTMDNVRQRCENVNRRIEDTGRYVRAVERNGYVALDEYATTFDVAGRAVSDACLRTITVGTKREIGEYLHAMIVGIDLSRTPR